ncbi:MAG: carbohydrate-binding domain-containing protein [Firmicutes bacterium]|nr:carbohydrate-binding domain-containing protein [Bacillota bacterium]
MKLKKLFALTLILALAVSFAACAGKADKNGDISDIRSIYPDSRVILLNGDTATLDGKEIEESDYTWHVDPSVSHSDVKNAPAEYYTGTKPETGSAVYIDHELYYYPKLDQSGFTLVNYDGEREYAYYYTDGENGDYIFTTLPVLGNSFPSYMMHTEEEAAGNKVLHITEAGTYVLKGEWEGQIWIDLGDTDDTFADESAKVTLVLDGADIECSVAPGIVFYSVYECDNGWEERENSYADIDITGAGAKIVVADGTENSVSGTNVFRMLKTKYKDEDDASAVKVQKKQRKTDGALYSYVSMIIEGGEEGTGTLSVTGGFEGIDSELHMAFNGGKITVNSQDDGMNVNEDYVSVIYFNGGEVTINAAQGAEGDGVDSNGFIVINGGKISVSNIRVPDSAFDSEMGVLYRDGEVIVNGETLQLEKGDQGNSVGGQAFGPGGQGGFPGGNGQEGFMPGQGGQHMGPQGQNFDMKEFKKKVSELPDDAGLEDVLELLGMNGGFGGNGQFPGGMNGGQGPQGMPGGQGGFPGGNTFPGAPDENRAERQ